MFAADGNTPLSVVTQDCNILGVAAFSCQLGLRLGSAAILPRLEGGGIALDLRIQARTSASAKVALIMGRGPEQLPVTSRSSESCRGLDFLDVASGEAHGTAVLALVARSAVAIDIDADTVTAPRPAFRRPNLHYDQGAG
jgi:hypothetical protein